MSQKNRKRKAEFTTPEERWMCLQEFEKDKNKKKSLAELAIIAKILLKREDDFDPSTIWSWKKNRERIREQAMVHAKRHKFDPRGQIKPVKNLLTSDEFKFQDELVEFFMKVGDYKNLTLRVMVHEARKYRAKFWPTLCQKNGRPAKKWINRRYISRLMETRDFTYHKIQGRPTPINKNVLQKAEVELQEALTGYTSAEIANFDESAIQLNNLGPYSFQPKGGLGPRSVNRIDAKARITVGQPILQNGKNDHRLLLINDTVPKALKKELKKFERKNKPGTKKRDCEMFNHKDFFFGVRENTFINRSIFFWYIRDWNRKLEAKGEKRLLLVDNLGSHYFDKDKHKEWVAENPERVIYTDDFTFSSIKLVFLPARTTAIAQPSDMGYYAYIQGQYRVWYNDIDDKDNLGRESQIKQIVNIFKGTSQALKAACWNRSVMKALHPASTENLPKMTSEAEKTFQQTVEVESPNIKLQPVDDTQEVEIDECHIDDSVLDEPGNSNQQNVESDSSTDSELEEILNAADPTAPGATPPQRHDDAPHSSLAAPTALSLDDTPATPSLAIALSPVASSSSADTHTAVTPDIAPPSASTSLTQALGQVKLGKKKKKNQSIKNQPRIDNFFKKTAK